MKMVIKKQLLKNLVTEYSNKKNNISNHENNTRNRDCKSKEITFDSKQQSKSKTWVKENGKDIAFISGKNLQQILCQKNKLKLLPNSQPEVYQLDCSCNGKCIGESKKRVLTRCIEHQQDSLNEKWKSSGATEHTKEWHGRFDWLHPKTVYAFFIHVRKKNLRSARNKQAKNK